jgi:hypothetical protein
MEKKMGIEDLAELFGEWCYDYGREAATDQLRSEVDPDRLDLAALGFYNDVLNDE